MLEFGIFLALAMLAPAIAAVLGDWLEKRLR
jgi:hypothetical protein